MTTITLPGSIKTHDVEPELAEALEYSLEMKEQQQAIAESMYDDEENYEEAPMRRGYDSEDERYDSKKKVVMEEDDEDMDDEEEEDEIPDFIKKKMKKDAADLERANAHIDSLEGELAIARTLLNRTDSEEDEETGERSDSDIEAAVQARLDSIFAAYDDAKPFLPDDFKLDGSSSAYSIQAAAIANFDSDIKLDSEQAVAGAYTAMKLWRRPSTGGQLEKLAIASSVRDDSRDNHMDAVKQMYANAWKGGN
ncbi:hypothetical protein H6F86_20485 [Phormidium sp. FACHB-592]|uniref:Uncharacterized protein n=1 Tax=Stenomitos frigidus AS-A4 TaxID=2933935 RepID=A0ABV0KGU6_9CYAN|nr:hypothetical protein [Phormidium sp. FACHB-592]MBD2076210.1 hypothetical protein [Phormidium sp. FACHB-592]